MTGDSRTCSFDATRDAASRVVAEGVAMSTVINQPELITPEGYERPTAELAQLNKIGRQEVADALREARADGGEVGQSPSTSLRWAA
jgi:hypothetical protein